MNAHTKARVTAHGEAIIAAFPNASVKEPMELCRKLRRIEQSVQRGGFQGLAWTRAVELLGSSECLASGLFIAQMPDQHALKLDHIWTTRHNFRAALLLPTDALGYGILSPDMSA